MYQNNISFLYFILIRLFAQKKRNYAVNNKMKNGSSGITQTKEISLWFVRLILSQNKCNHTIFRHDNFIGCLSADKIKMPVRKYFCFNIPVYRNMAEAPSCRSPYHKEYIQTSVSGSPEGLCHLTYNSLSKRR